MNQKEQSKRQMIYCEPCGYKKIYEIANAPNLIEVKTSAIQGHLPQLDPATKKTIVTPSTPQDKKCKCPSCGRAVRIKELLKPFAEAYQKVDSQEEKDKLNEERRKRIEDGKPKEKVVDPTFLA